MPDTGRTAGLDPEFFRYLEAYRAAALRELGITVTIVSGKRSYAEQQYLYDGWVRRLPGFNLAAKPGTSRHESGYAIDQHPNVDQAPALRPLLVRFGLGLPVPGESWHVEPVWIRGGVKPPLPADTPEPAPTPEPDPLEDEMAPRHGLYREPDGSVWMLTDAGRMAIKHPSLVGALVAGGDVAGRPDGTGDFVALAAGEQLDAFLSLPLAPGT